MTDKEKLDAIRAEIHRLVDVRGYDRGMANDLFAFMNSLPNEPVSDELEEAAKKAATQFVGGEEKFFWNDYHKFKAGANWQKQQTIDKAAEWLSELDDALFLGYDNDGYPYIDRDGLARDFKKYMEDKQ